MLRNKANELLAKYIEATNAEDTQRIMEVKAELDLALEELNADIKAKSMGNLLDLDNSVLEACKQGYYTLVKIATDKEKTFKFTDKIEIIDLEELATLQRMNFKPFYTDNNAIFYIEALNHAVLNYLVAKMGIKSKAKKLEGFKLSATAQALEISEADMKTQKGLTSALQKVTNSIVDGLKVTSDEAETLLFNYSKWSSGNINGVSMAIEANFRKMIMRVLYKVANGGEFIAE